MNFIGLSGVAKAGKDTFCQGIKDAYPELKIARISIGDIIRDKLYSFLFFEFDINVWQCTPEQKQQIRPLLAWYGDFQRKRTEGRFFIDQLEKMLPRYVGMDCLVLTDLRFKEFAFDETDWIHSKGGKVVHIRRLSPTGGSIEPANDLEKINDPKVQEVADVKVVWETMLPSDHFEIEVADRVRKLGLLEQR